MINTGTTIVTFLMVFLIQNTQNRDARAIHLKLDELIRGIKGARNKLVDLENCSDEEIAALEQEFKKFRERQAARTQQQQQHHNGKTNGNGARNRQANPQEHPAHPAHPGHPAHPAPQR